MRRWVQLDSSSLGNRAGNEDIVMVSTCRYSKKRVSVLIACDGVGGRPGGGKCAKAISLAVRVVVERYLRKRRSARALDGEDAKRLTLRLHHLWIRGIDDASATTLALVLFDRCERKKGYKIITIWAGDSRAYLIDSKGELRKLTNDHHDAEGRLTSFFTGDGRAHGEIGSLCVTLKGFPCVICITTDGVHESCTPDELKNFLLYCVNQGIRTREDLTIELSNFLRYNLSDNYSMILFYHPMSLRNRLKYKGDKRRGKT